MIDIALILPKFAESKIKCTRRASLNCLIFKNKFYALALGEGVGTSRPVTLATFRMSVEARLCQGCAHSAHPQGSALIELGLHATSHGDP